MSLQEQARQLIDQAGVAIQAGNPQYATELLRQSILYNGKDAEAFILLGIALAQTGMPADAENAFKKATHLAPDNVKARYNLAVHQYSEGQLRAALNSARKASELDALHAGSQNLITRIEEDLGLEHGEEPKTTAAGNPAPPEYRDGYEEQPVQTIPTIERLGKIWDVIGWSIGVLSLVLAIWFVSVVMPYFTHAGGSADKAIQGLSASSSIVAIRILYFLVNIGGLIFIATDAIHRRGNLLWLLPQAVCGCTGFTFLIMPLYLIFGRNN